MEAGWFWKNVEYMIIAGYVGSGLRSQDSVKYFFGFYYESFGIFN